jgi:hypothetical protein
MNKSVFSGKTANKMALFGKTVERESPERQSVNLCLGGVSERLLTASPCATINCDGDNPNLGKFTISVEGFW